jgi:hypothetical protein
LVANTYDSFNYVFSLFDKSQPANSPIASAVAYSYSHSYSQGECGLVVFNDDQPPLDDTPGNSTSGCDVTFDNYSASAPALNQNPSAWPAMVTDLYPTPGGKGLEFNPIMKVGIFNRETTVNTTSIVLYQDGTLIPNGSLTIVANLNEPANPAGYQTFDGATVTYTIPTVYPPGSVHNSACVFNDNEQPSVIHSNYWTWTTGYGALWASNSLPVGSLTVPGVDARMVSSLAAGRAGRSIPSELRHNSNRPASGLGAERD